MSDECEADRRARLLRVNRLDQAAELRALAETFGPGHGNDRLRELIAASATWVESSDPADPYHPDNGLDTIGRDLQKTMTRFGIDPDRFAGVRIVGTAHTDVTVQLNQYDDGSALIMVGDAAIAVLNMFCRFTTLGLAPLIGLGHLDALEHRRRVEQRGTVFEDPKTIAWMLRYYLVCQRLEGGGGYMMLNLDSHEQLICRGLLDSATQFVIAHELAHRALGHAPETMGFGPGTQMPTCSADQQREMDADALALRVVLDDQRRRFTAPARIVETMAVLGIESGMLALHAIERAVFVRNGHTHPPAEARAAQLLKATDPDTAQIASAFLPSLQRVADAASTFDETSELIDWPRMQASPYDIHRDRPRDRIEFVRYLDSTQCIPDDELFNRFRHGEPALSDGATLLRDGRLREALQAWNLEAADIEAIADPRQALTFHGLIDAIRGGWEPLPLPDPVRFEASIAAASLIAGRVPSLASAEYGPSS